MSDTQMELGFGNAGQQIMMTPRQKRLSRANWWFQRMRQGADSLIIGGRLIGKTPRISRSRRREEADFSPNRGLLRLLTSAATRSRAIVAFADEVPDHRHFGLARNRVGLDEFMPFDAQTRRLQ